MIQSINSLIGRWWEGGAKSGRLLADLILPPQCLACDNRLSNSGQLCARCWTQIDFVSHIPRNSREMASSHSPGSDVSVFETILEDTVYDRVGFVARYDGVARDLVHALKYRDRLDVARPMADWMSRAGSYLLADCDVVVPVPLNRFRYWYRQYNQAALLAYWMTRDNHPAYRDDLLMRTRSTKPQVGLSVRQRRDNVRNAFVVPEARIGDVSGKRVVLIDDVITTGATVDACARILHAAGADHIDVLVFARVIDPV